MRLRILCGLAILGVVLSPSTGHAQRPMVTVAANGIVRVTRTMPLTVTAGVASYRIDLDDAIPVSISTPDSGVRILEVRRELEFDELEALRTSVGREFDLALAEDRVVRRRLLGVEPERWSHPSGAVELERPGRILWPDAVIHPGSGLLLTLMSDRPRADLRLEYEVAGGSWAAVYALTLGSLGDFSGRAVLATGRLRLDTASVRLIAGDLGPQARPLPRASSDYTGRGVVANALVPRDQVISRALLNTYIDGIPVAPTSLSGQVYLYTLPLPVVFRPGREVAVPLVESVPVTPVKRLSVGGVLVPLGEVMQDPATRQVAVTVSYDLERSRGTQFGELPLPAGVVSVHDVGPDGVSRLVGRSTIGHVAPGNPLQVNVGASFDVTATRAQTSYQVTARGADGQANGATIGFRLELRNAGDTAVTVTAYESRMGDWQILESSQPAERRASGAAAFVVRVPPRGETTLTYRLRVVW